MAISQQIVLQQYVGTPFSKISSIITIPDQEQELFVFTVPAMTVRVIYSLTISAIIDLRWYLESDSETISHGINSPSVPEVQRYYTPPISIGAGKVVRLKIKSVAGVQSVTCRSELRAIDIVE